MVCFSLTSTALAKDEVVGTEELTEGTGSNSIHGARFEIDEDSAGNIFVVGCLVSNELPFEQVENRVEQTSLK